jgi:hypothetical protein
MIMRRILPVLYLLIGSSGFATAHTRAPNPPKGVRGVDFCDLFRYPERYRGKTVETTAIYVADIEHVTFVNARCIPEARANAVFTDSTHGSKKIARALRHHKLRPALLTVTVVATFVDEYAGNVITFRGTRYSLDVKKVVAATKFNTK